MIQRFRRCHSSEEQAASYSALPWRRQSPRCRRIYEKCCELSAAGETPDYARLTLVFEDRQIQTLLVDLDEAGQGKRDTTDLPRWLEGLLVSFRDRVDEPRDRALAADLQHRRVDEQQQLKILEESLKSKRRRQGISEPTDG